MNASFRGPSINLKARLCLALCLLAAAFNDARPDSLAEIRGKSRSDRFEVPSQDSLRLAEELFTLILGGCEKDCRISSLCVQLSLDLKRIGSRGDGFIVLHEPLDQQRGRGLYAFRKTGGKKPVLLQAPHSFYDLHTGKIAELLFTEGRFAAAAWNTVHRFSEQNGKDEPADLCRVAGSFLHALSSAFAAVFPEGRVVQIHGFSQQKRKSSRAGSSDIILSNGSRNPALYLRRLSADLAPHFNNKISVFPVDVKELGGTKNTIGRLLRSLKHDGFLHIEVSKPARSRLLKDAELRRMFMSGLQK